MILMLQQGCLFPGRLLYYGNVYMEDDMNLDVKRLLIAVVVMVLFVVIFIITSGN